MVTMTLAQGLEIPTAEKDIIDAVRIAVNTPFMQVSQGCACSV